MFEAFTYNNLMQRCLARVPDTMDKREGSVIWDALAPACAELELAYLCMEYALNQGFADTAEEPYLSRRTSERGIVPSPATYAVLKGEFTPTTVAVQGKRFNLGEINYIVGDAIAGEAGAYEITCETAGAIGHKVLGNLIPIEYVDGLETAAATAILIPGQDKEDAESLRTRYNNSFNQKPYGGNVKDYVDKVEGFPGVGGCRVTPVWQGGGTVKCTILDATFGPASQTLIDDVKEYIDPIGYEGEGYGAAPIGHIVTVETAGQTAVNINTQIEFDTDYSWDNMMAVIRAAIEEYLLELRTAWKNYKTGTVTTVRISQIETRILALEGVIDVTDTTINDSSGNLLIGDNKIPVLGVITHAQNG